MISFLAVSYTHLDVYKRQVLGRRLLGEHQYAQAAEVWKNVSTKTWASSPFSDDLTENPFYIKPDNGQTPSQSISPAAFAARMVQLETQMKAGDAQAAYLLACGAYNMGYFGNSWLLLNRQRSSSEYEYTYPPRDLTGVDYYTSAKAKTYFEKALQLTLSLIHIYSFFYPRIFCTTSTMLSLIHI